MNNKKIYIILFVILYAFVAIVSGIHGFAFFSLANTPLLAGMLAVAFEIGQAAVLFSILTNPGQRKKIMPWILMIILTLVQVMGNVYNCYRYLILNSEEGLRFFKEPIFVWTDIPDAQANVILSYVMGAILPIVALLLTSMVTSFLGKEQESIEEVEYIEEPEEIEEDNTEKEYPEDRTPYGQEPEELPEPYNSLSGIKLDENGDPVISKEFSKEEDKIDEDKQEKNEDKSKESEKSILKPIDEPENDLQENPKEEVKNSPEVKLDTNNEVLKEETKPEVKEQSHFINI